VELGACFPSRQARPAGHKSETFPCLETLPSNGARCLAMIRLIRGNALMKASAISLPWSRVGQHKSLYFRRREGCSFSDPIADAIILRQDNPTTAADFDQPKFVFGVRSKMVIVDLDPFADIA
jgi:hypothetical protein